MEDVENTKENCAPLSSTAPPLLSQNKNHSIDEAPINQHENGKIETNCKEQSIDGLILSREDEKRLDRLNTWVDDSEIRSTFDGHEDQQKPAHLSDKDPETLKPPQEENVTGLSERSMVEESPDDDLKQSLECDSVQLQSNATFSGLNKEFSIVSADKEDILEPQKDENPPQEKEMEGEDVFAHVDNIIIPTASSPRVNNIENGDQPHVEVSRGAMEVPVVIDPSKHLKKINVKKGQIDTAAPFESVKAAVSKFGGIVDWKAHKVQTVERRALVEEELEKAQGEITIYKNQSEAAKFGKIQTLKQLDSTQRLVEELKLKLERAQTEEQQAKQDSQLATLRVEEMEQGIADESSVAAKAQLEVAKARQVAAVSELKTVKNELQLLKRDNDLLSTEKDLAVKKAEEAVFVCKEVEKRVEELMVELIAAKESLDSAHVAHLEEEEKRIGLDMAKEEDILTWKKELEVAEEELERLNQEISSSKNLKSKVDIASTLLVELKTELAAYMEPKLENDEEGQSKGEMEEIEKRTHAEMQAAVALTENELEQVKLKVEKAIGEVNSLKESATSLKLEIEREKSECANTMQREGMASVAVASLEAELSKTRSEIADFRTKEREIRDRMAELPKQLQVAAQEADQAKLEAQTAREEFGKAMEETEKAKAEASTKESKLFAVKKDIEAARESEKLGLSAIHALKESELAQTVNGESSPASVAISLEEYYELTKRAHDAGRETNLRVSNAISLIEVAKESELTTLKKLEKVGSEMAAKKEALEIALEKAENAKEGKLRVEQELRNWRAQNEQRRKESESGNGGVNQIEERKESNNFVQLPAASISIHQRLNPRALSGKNAETETSSELNVAKKKKRSFFPRILMFLVRRKAQAAKSM